MPLLAFDRMGGRLGYGAGYYDRTLPLLASHFTMGCAFAAQATAAVPMGPRDIPLDVLATEREVILCPGGPRPVHGVPGTAPLFP